MALPTSRSAKLWLALLHELDRAGGEAAPAALYPTLRAYFPELTDSDVARVHKTGGNAWMNQIQWARQHLVRHDCLDRRTRGVWRITPLGRRWLAAHWRGPEGDYAAVPRPARSAAPEAAAPETDAVAAPPADAPIWPPQRPTTGSLDLALGDAGPLQVRRVRGAVRRPAGRGDDTGRRSAAQAEGASGAAHARGRSRSQQLCRRLEESQRQSGTPRVFEEHLTAAFVALGFEATHIGGSGETDVFVRAALGARSYSAVIDGKTTRNGRAIDSQINFHAIEAHRQGRGAQFAAVIGVDFSNGQLQKFADQSKVTLITTAMLVELLRLHARIPFTLLELRELFAGAGRAEASVQALRERHQQHARHWELIAEVIDTIGRYAPPKVDNLWYAVMAQARGNARWSLATLTLQDVEAAVAFLSSRAVNVLAEVPGSDGAFQLVVPAVARQRLAALARFVDTQPRSGSEGVAPHPATDRPSSTGGGGLAHSLS